MLRDIFVTRCWSRQCRGARALERKPLEVTRQLDGLDAVGIRGARVVLAVREAARGLRHRRAGGPGMTSKASSCVTWSGEKLSSETSTRLAWPLANTGP